MVKKTQKQSEAKAPGVEAFMDAMKSMPKFEGNMTAYINDQQKFMAKMYQESLKAMQGMIQMQAMAMFEATNRMVKMMQYMQEKKKDTPSPIASMMKDMTKNNPMMQSMQEMQDQMLKSWGMYGEHMQKKMKQGMDQFTKATKH